MPTARLAVFSEGTSTETLEANWPAFRTYLEIVYGIIDPSNIWAPGSRHMISLMKEHVHDILTRGIQVVGKELSDFAREQAIHTPRDVTSLRGKLPEHIFIASTLARGLIVPKPTKEAVQLATLQGLDRICEESPLPSLEVMDAIRAFVKSLKLKNKSDKVTLPTPSTKACYEQSSRQGGASCILNSDLAIKDEWVMQAEEDAYLESRIERDVKDPNASWEGDHRHFDEYMNSEDHNIQMQVAESIGNSLMSRYIDENGFYIPIENRPNRRTYEELFRYSTEEARFNRKAKILPIVQPDGKIRVATLHTASVVWASRAMTAHLIPSLKGVIFTRAMLRNRPVNLHQAVPKTTKLVLYSADFSKSTDPISIGLARHVLETITDDIGRPDWWNDALQATVATHQIELPDGKTRTSQCGALMGLGAGWTVLNILNAYCAHAAGAPLGSYAVCGDDLIGLWTTEQILRYEHSVDSIHLKLNKQKSYIASEYGVFCERFVKRESRTHATAHPLLRIGEAVGARAEDKGRGSSVTDCLSRSKTSCRPLRNATIRTILRTCITSNIPGLHNEGGGGTGSPDLLTLLSYLKYGPTQLFESESSSAYRGLRKRLRELPNVPNGIPAEDILTNAMGLEEMKYRLQHKVPTADPLFRTRKSVHKEIQRRRGYIGSLLKQLTVGQTVQRILSGGVYSRWTPSMLRPLWRLIRSRRYCAGITFLKKSWSKTIDPTQAEQALRNAVPNVQYYSVYLKTLKTAPLVRGLNCRA